MELATIVNFSALINKVHTHQIWQLVPSIPKVLDYPEDLPKIFSFFSGSNSESVGTIR